MKKRCPTVVKVPSTLALARLSRLRADVDNSMRLIKALQQTHPHLIVTIDVERPRLRLLGTDEAA